MAELLVLYDGNALVHRAFHAVKPLTTAQGEPTNAVFGFATMLLKSLSDLKPNYGAVAFDRSAPTFRHLAYTEYKAHRERMADDLRPQFSRVRELVAAFGLPIFELDGFEADDVLGTLARQAVAHGLEVVIITGDTDALQLVGPHVRVLTPSRGIAEAVMYDVDAVKARYGLDPHQIIDFKAMKGDSSDNIKGLPGVGEKTAQKLLARFGSIDTLLGLPVELEPKFAKVIDENREALLLSRQLTTILSDVPVTLDPALSRIGGYDRGQLIELLRDLEFRSLIDRLPAVGRAHKKSPIQPMLFDDPALPDNSTIREEIAEIAVASIGDYRVVLSLDDLDALATELRLSKGFAFDTETDQLGGLTAPLIGLSFSARAGSAWYIPVAHRLTTETQLSIDDVVSRLKPILNDSSIPKTAHNAKYDLQVLRRYDMDVKGLTFDSMIAAFVLDSSTRVLNLKDMAWNLLKIEMTPITNLIGKGKQQVSLADVPLAAVVQYAGADADVSLRLREYLEPRIQAAGLFEVLSSIEMPCVPVLTAMEEAGIAVDVHYLLAMSDDLAGKVTLLEREIYELVGHEFNINSPAQLGKVLFDELHLPHGRKTQTGWSTDADTLEELRGTHDIIERLFDYRQVSKLKSTYVDALPTMVNPRTGRIHTSYNQVGASTGRLSSSDPNLQNIPIRTELGRAVRRAFIAGSPDTVLLGADYSQVELRILAHITKDPALLEAFARGQDIHQSTASLVFNVPIETVTSDQRRFAKVVNYGIAYGIGDFGLSVQAGIPRSEAGQIIRSYLERYTGIARYIDETKKMCERQGYVETLMGRRIQVPEIGSANRQIRSSAERRAINAPIQGSNADFLKIAMCRIAEALRERGLATRMLLQVHDELVFEVPRGEIAEVSALARDIMSNAYALDPPLEVEIKIGNNWADVE